MAIDAKKKQSKPVALEIKSSNFSMPVIILSTGDLALIVQELTQKISLAPEFFKKSPVLLDFQALNVQENEVDVAALINSVRDLDLLPIGIRGGTQEQNSAAQAGFIPVFSIHTGKASAEPQKPAPTPTVSEVESPPIASTLLTLPVRSGQRVYAKGDLVIMAQVSAGAEIMAEGNIHVYNTLRGRALAGVLGNQDARIFCFDLQAELVSIAGNYKMSDDFGVVPSKKPIQIYLQGQTLVFKELM